MGRKGAMTLQMMMYLQYMNRTLYQEYRDVTGQTFLTTSTDNNPICSAIEFFDLYNVHDKKLGEVVAADAQSEVMLAFNESILEDHLKKLYESITLLDNCKPAQLKYVHPMWTY